MNKSIMFLFLALLLLTTVHANNTTITARNAFNASIINDWNLTTNFTSITYSNGNWSGFKNTSVNPVVFASGIEMYGAIGQNFTFYNDNFLLSNVSNYFDIMSINFTFNSYRMNISVDGVTIYSFTDACIPANCPRNIVLTLPKTSPGNISFRCDAFLVVKCETNITSIQFLKNSTYTSTNGSIRVGGFSTQLVSPFPLPTLIQTINYTASATNYYSKSIFGLNPLNNFTQNITLSLIGGLNVTLFNANTSARLNIGSNSTLRFQSANNSQTSVTVLNNTSSGIVYNLSENQQYQLQITAPGFSTAIYTFTYNSTLANEGLNVYLSPTAATTNLKIFVVNEIRVPFPGAQVSIDRYINNSYQSVGSQVADSSGAVVFPLDTSFTHRITVGNGTSYIPSISVYNPLQLASAAASPITIQILPVSSGDVITSDENVFYQYAPREYTLPPINNTFLFNASVYNTSQILDSLGITVYVDSINSTNLIGTTTYDVGTFTAGNVSLTLNLSAYQNRTLFAYYVFQKVGYPSFTKVVVYEVGVIPTNGTIQGFEDWVQSSVTVTDRIILYTLLLFVFVVLLSVFVKGIYTPIISALFALILAYVFFGAIGLFIATIPVFILILFIAATGVLS
jgi:hypothetical protein